MLNVRDPTPPLLHAEIAASLEGQLIAGKYRVERLIGVGGMGVVVSALHLDLERHVAIKLIRDELTRDRSTLQRFLLEARAAAKMTNEHICRVLDVDKLENGAPFIVMELLQGCDLAATLEERGRVDPVECVDWILQACEGVAEAHSLHIVHRDLKPANLFMTRFGDGSACIKVLDFGISKAGGRAVVTNSLTAPRTLVGSPRYMAPEQMLFSAANERTDVWALGTILYEMLTGSPAFDGDSVPAVCARVINEPPVPPRARAPEVPAELQRVILRCLERDPNARYPNVAALAADLAPLGSASAASSYRKIAAILGTPSLPPGLPLRLALSTDSAVQLAPTHSGRRRRPWHWAALPFALLGSVWGFQSLRRSKLVVVQGGTVTVPASLGAAGASTAQPAAAGVLPARAAPAAVHPKLVHSEGARPSPAPTSAPAAARAAASFPPGAAPAPSTFDVTEKGLARRAPGPARSGVPASPNLQEAWDVSKFGGRE